MRVLYSLALALSLSLIGYSQTSGQAKSVPAADRTFLREAVQANEAEITLAHLAEQKTSTLVVKQFAQRMVTDHTKLKDDTTGLASRLGVSLPTGMNAEDKAQHKALSAKSGNAFDKAYIEDMLKDHRHDISAFQKEANSGGNADVKALAQQALPTLQEHLHLAEDAAKQLRIPTTPSGEEMR